MAEGTCAHIEAITTVKHAKRRECDECVKIGARLGPSADLPGVRHDALLRRLAEPPRHQARADEQTSRDRIGGARGALVVLLSGRRVCGVLSQAEFEMMTEKCPMNISSVLSTAVKLIESA